MPPPSFLRGKIKKKSAKWPNEGFFFKVAPHTPWGRKEGGKEAKKKALKTRKKKKATKKQPRERGRGIEEGKKINLYLKKQQKK